MLYVKHVKAIKNTIDNQPTQRRRAVVYLHRLVLNAI